MASNCGKDREDLHPEPFSSFVAVQAGQHTREYEFTYRSKRQPPESVTSYSTRVTAGTEFSNASIASSDTDLSDLELHPLWSAEAHEVFAYDVLDGIGAHFDETPSATAVHELVKQVPHMRPALNIEKRRSANYASSKALDSTLSAQSDRQQLAAKRAQSNSPHELIGSGRSEDDIGVQVQASNQPSTLAINRPPSPLNTPSTNSRLDASITEPHTDDVVLATSSADGLPARAAVHEASQISNGTSVDDATDQLRSRLQLSCRRVQQAYEEYSSYLETVAEREEGETTEEESEADTEYNTQEGSSTPGGSGYIGTGNASGSSPHDVTHRRTSDLRNKRTLEEDNNSEDEDRHKKTQRPLSRDGYNDQLATSIVCLLETCEGLDDSISQWLQNLQHHGWYVCCECLGPPFNSKEELDAHKRSSSCVPHCVYAKCMGNHATAEGVRHVSSKACPARGRHVRRARYEYVCQLLGKHVKPFVQGRKIAHVGVKQRKRNSREDAERKLRESLVLEVADLKLHRTMMERDHKNQLALAERDLKDAYSVIRRLAEDLHMWSSIPDTTLDDMERLPKLLTEQQRARFATAPLNNMFGEGPDSVSATVGADGSSYNQYSDFQGQG